MDPNKSGDKAWRGQSRRQNRAKRQDVYRMWQDGSYNEEATSKERWSREAKNPRKKVNKEKFVNFAEDVLIGRVIEVHRRTSVVKIAGEDEITVRYSPLLSENKKRHDLAVGDLVNVRQEAQSEELYITEIQPRFSKFSRPGPMDRRHQELILASNIDQVAVVSSVLQPDFNMGFVDRYLVASRYSELEIILIVNKMDLVKDMGEEVREYFDLVDKVVLVSSKDRSGVEELRDVLKDKISVLTGQSGVGKSSLVQNLIPGLELRVNDVREKDGKGRHTTTASTLFDLPFGGSVIDTPGIRTLGLRELPKTELGFYFPGFADYLNDCRFSDCLHINEPGCKILEALNEEKIEQVRYNSYLRILSSLDE